MTVNPLPKRPPQILTAAGGRFAFGNLGAGTYLIRATKGGYAEGASGRRRPGGEPQPVDISPAAKSADVVVRMWKYGVITGTVSDEAGEPVVGLQVRLIAGARPGMPPSPVSGFVAIARPYTSVGAPVQTDDRGIYRFINLPAGEYFVIAGMPPISANPGVFDDALKVGRGGGDLAGLAGAGGMTVSRAVDMRTPLRIGDAVVALGSTSVIPPPAGGRLRIYPPTFYPAAQTLSQATAVTLSTGEERGGVDIQLQPSTVARVSGLLAADDGGLVTLRLSPTGSEGLTGEFAAPASVTDAGGSFLFAAVPPGRYTLRGSLRGQRMVNVPVVVGADDIDGLVVTPSPPLKLTATLQFDGGSPPPVGTNGRGPLPMPAFLLDPADANPLDSMMYFVDSDRAYVMTGYPPGRYRVRVVNSPAGWMFKAAMLNGADVSETPFDFNKDAGLTLVFTDRWTGISGAAQGPGSDGVAIVVFPTDAARWSGDGFAPRRFKSTRANARGEFGVSALPPGDYFVAAIPDEQTDDWRNPAMLDALARVATRVTIMDGEHSRVALRVSEVRQ
jgi:hypothetical protein